MGSFSMDFRIRSYRHLGRRRMAESKLKLKKKAIFFRRIAESKRKKKSIFFPEELVEQIFLRLPVKSLLRFKCLCKTWYNHLSAKEFTYLHFNTYKPPDVLLSGIITRPGRIVLSTLSLPTGGCAEAVTIVHHRLSYKKLPKGVTGFYKTSKGPCNGIFCLISGNGEFLLWNPRIHDFKIIPRSSLPRRRPRTTSSCSCSTVEFGFDPKTTDYKILCVLFDLSGNQHQHQHQLELYSLHTNSWKSLDASTFNSFKISCGTRQFTTNGKIGWLAFDYDMPAGSRHCEIYLFDLSSEAFDRIPVYLESDIVSENLSVFPFRETIAVVVTQHYGLFDIWDIWALNEFDCTQSKSKSWSKLLTMQLGLGSQPKPIGFWGSSCLIFRKKDWSLVLYNLINRSSRDLAPGVGPLILAVPYPVYKESLIYISDKKKRNEIFM